MDRSNLRVFIFLLLAGWGILAGRLFQLQIVDGRNNRILADSNRIVRIKIDSPRGLIKDRRGEILADNIPVYVLTEKDNQQVIDREEALRRQAAGEDSNLKIQIKRRYLGGEFLAHALGYLGEVTADELKNDKLDLKGYLPGSLIGRAGLEAEYEELLRGRDGSELMEVDTTGQVVRRLSKILPTPGKTLTLALDQKLQEAAAKAMNGKKGAVVATDPRNGEVLLFYSSPSFDPNLFLAEGEKRQSLNQILTDEENLPLLNRVINGLYPPGSTFKIITAMAGLAEGKITPQTLITDTGILTYGNFKYTNWYYTGYGRTEGDINVVRALARSNDIFFYKLGEMVGVEALNKWAEIFRINQKTGIDLPAETSGFIATPEWKQKVKGESWFLGNTYHLAIGQGDLDMTPLGVNLMTGVVANGGKICTPRMLKLGAANTPYQADCQEIGVKKEYLEVIKKGMIGACAPGGTAGQFFNFEPKVACKTGTAETGDGKAPHAWFTVFAPIDNPEIVLTVLVEHGGEGSSTAAPVAKEILKEFFKEQE